MNVRWRLRMAAAQKEVWTGAELRRLLAERAGLADLCGIGVGAVDQAASPAEVVDVGCAVHRAGVHPQRSARGRHHPGGGQAEAGQGSTRRRPRSREAGRCRHCEAHRLCPLRSRRRLQERELVSPLPGGRSRDDNCGPSARPAASSCVSRTTPAAACVVHGHVSTADTSCVSRRACGAESAACEPHAIAAKSPCPRCGRPGFIRAETGWCGSCSRRPSPPLVARPCSMCGELRRKKGEGMCHRCWTRSPTRPITQAENLLSSLEDPPDWLVGFASFAAERHCVARACVMVTAVGRLLRDGQPSQPQALLERARRPGRSAGSLARTLEEFFVTERLAFGLDQDARLALGRRQRRVNAVPAPLRPAVARRIQVVIATQLLA